MMSPDRLLLSTVEGRSDVRRLFSFEVQVPLMMQCSDLRCLNGTDIMRPKLEQMVLGRDAKPV